MNQGPRRNQYWPLVAAVATLGACNAEGLAFRVDDRLQVLEPSPGATVSLPFTVRWTVEDFALKAPDGSDDPGAGYFGLFVDGTPIAPGQPLSDVARGDDACAATPGCPDAQYLRERNVYTSTETRFTLENVPERPSAEPGESQSHEVTIVLLNGRSERIGETALPVEFVLAQDEG